MSKEKKSKTKKTLVRGMFVGKDMKIEIAPQHAVLSKKDDLGKLLIAIGHPEALVTDESRISDFRPVVIDKGMWVENTEWNNRVIARCKSIFGVDISQVFEKKFPELLEHIKKNQK